MLRDIHIFWAMFCWVHIFGGTIVYVATSRIWGTWLHIFYAYFSHIFLWGVSFAFPKAWVAYLEVWWHKEEHLDVAEDTCQIWTHGSHMARKTRRYLSIECPDCYQTNTNRCRVVLAFLNWGQNRNFDIHERSYVDFKFSTSKSN